jgi:hypothetical protein
MKTNRFAYNVVGLIIAGLGLFAALSTLFVVLPGTPNDKRGFEYFLASIEFVTALTVGAGGILNLVKRRGLGPWPTGIMIAGYCASVWLVPLALWGIVSLLVERRHRRNEPGNAAQI